MMEIRQVYQPYINLPINSPEFKRETRRKSWWMFTISLA